MSNQITKKYLAVDTAKDAAAMFAIYTAIDMAKANNLIGAALVGAIGISLIVVDKVLLFRKVGLKL